MQVISNEFIPVFPNGDTYWLLAHYSKEILTTAIRFTVFYLSLEHSLLLRPSINSILPSEDLTQKPA
jgi:hypothetical protein